VRRETMPLLSVVTYTLEESRRIKRYLNGLEES